MKLSLRPLLLWNGLLESLVGLAIFVYPELPLSLLFGTSTMQGGRGAGLLFGMALFTVGYICWSARLADTLGQHAAGRGLQTYNLLAAVILAYFAFRQPPAGVLALPAAVLHFLLWLAFTVALAQDMRRLRSAAADEQASLPSPGDPDSRP